MDGQISYVSRIGLYLNLKCSLLILWCIKTNLHKAYTILDLFRFQSLYLTTTAKSYILQPFILSFSKSWWLDGTSCWCLYILICGTMWFFHGFIQDSYWKMFQKKAINSRFYYFKS